MAKVCLLLIYHHTMKAHMEMEVKLLTFLTLVMDGGEWSTSCSGHLTTLESNPGAKQKVGWKPTVSLDAVGKRKMSAPAQN
jgi:hypothetical protein